MREARPLSGTFEPPTIAMVVNRGEEDEAWTFCTIEENPCQLEANFINITKAYKKSDDANCRQN